MSVRVARTASASTVRGKSPSIGPGALVVDPLLRQEMEELVSSMCKALNDPKRLITLYALREGPRSVGELCHALGIPQANMSQHLAVLRERGLVSAARRENRVLYSLRHPKILDAVDTMRGVLADEIARQQAASNPARSPASSMHR